MTVCNLRLATYKNRITAEDVRQYRYNNNCTLHEAKRILEDEVKDVLEYYDYDIAEWVPVQRVEVYRDE